MRRGLAVIRALLEEAPEESFPPVA
jgi:hypothetical protein